MVSLCRHSNCRLIDQHSGPHINFPTEAWNFLKKVDKNKINKAGFATPRGGAKGAYQNHVTRNSKVIIPFERKNEADLSLFKDGYVFRLYPEQYFDSPGVPKQEFHVDSSPDVVVGENAFILYRSHDSLESYPPLPQWEVRYLSKNGNRVTTRRGDVRDHGHYVLRITQKNNELSKRHEGPPQGIFAPEYATDELNYLSKVMLAWLIVISDGSPYTTLQARHLRLILQAEGYFNPNDWENKGITFRGFSSCPLCHRVLTYKELHETIRFDDEDGLLNASDQIQGVTRSTKVNLFHINPLMYQTLDHVPDLIAWGHAVCNTRLGQRRCYSISELIEHDNKIAVLNNGHYETIGWISDDWKMIKSTNGAVWIQIVNEYTEEEIKQLESYEQRSFGESFEDSDA